MSNTNTSTNRTGVRPATGTEINQFVLYLRCKGKNGKIGTFLKDSKTGEQVTETFEDAYEMLLGENNISREYVADQSRPSLYTKRKVWRATF